VYASYTPDEYTVLHIELQNKYRCAEYSLDGPKYCYRPPGTTKHIQLNSANLGAWATAIQNKAATITCPPRNPEFDFLLNGPAKRSISSKSDHVQMASNNPTIVPIYLPPPVYLDRSFETPRKHRNMHRTIDYHTDIMASPAFGRFQSQEYRTVALEAFLEWCTNKFGDDEFKAAYAQLSKHKIGVDLIAETDISTFETKCGLTYGTALQLKKLLPKWRATL